MADTQWRRYQVFLQEKEGDPYQDVGSVHAPDPEMALLNARDVFARRPSCTGLWVVPAEEIYSITRDQGLGTSDQETSDQRSAISDQGHMDGSLVPSHQSLVTDNYYVFMKTKHAGTQTLAGEVQAASPAEAMQVAIEQFAGEKPPLACWVFPARLVIHSLPKDIDSMFAPALDKPFRLSTGFRTVSAMREIKSGSAKSGPRS